MIKHERKFPAVLGVFFIVLILTIVVILIKSLMQSNSIYIPKYTQNIENKTKTYTSKEMHFTVQAPINFSINDDGLTLGMVSNNEKITAVRNGTNFNNINDYIADYDLKRKAISSNVTNLEIDGNPAMSRDISFPDQNINQKSYFIYKDNYVYIFSTSSESLFDDLDQIAQSFRYTK